MLVAFDSVPYRSSPRAQGPRRLLVHGSLTKRSTDFLARLDQFAAAYGTAERIRPLLAILDSGAIHRSDLTMRALAQCTRLTLEWLPIYASELNNIERCWCGVMQHYRANRTPACTGAGSSPMLTLSTISSLTLSPASTTSGSPIHRHLSDSLLSAEVGEEREPRERMDGQPWKSLTNSDERA